MITQDSYRILFSEIIKGCTTVVHSNYKKLYIKHFSYLETGQLDEEYNSYLYEATSQHIPSYKEREVGIIKDGLWSNDKEQLLIQNEKVISDLKITISRDYLHSRRRMLRGQIKEIQRDINKLQFEKNFLIGATAESHANKKLTFFRISSSFFRDEALKIPLVAEYEDEISEKYYSELINLYNDFQAKFDSNNISKIALSPFFSSIFQLTPEDPYCFYGKPIIDLTAYQIDLFGTASYFRNILSKRPDIPREIYNNPEELMEWIEVNQAADDAKIFDDSNEKGGAMSLPGATKEDLKMLGAVASTKMDKVSKKLREKGKLDMNELFELTQ